MSERKVLFLDMSSLSVEYREIAPESQFLGGRALSSFLVSRLVPPRCDPLRADNVLVLAPGIVTGTRAPASGRLSVGGKSPLTGGIKEANAGGLPGQMIARLGLQAIVIEGTAEASQGPYLLLVNAQGAEVIPVPFLRGLGTYSVVARIRDLYGSVGLITIGPAGEHGACAAGISCNDAEGGPGRMAARGGLGGVMGSKGLKGIVVDPRGSRKLAAHDPGKFEAACNILARALNEHSSVVDSLRPLGTAGIVEMVNEMGLLPTMNFHSGHFEGASRLTGEVISQLAKARGGSARVGKGCHPGCAIRCSNVFAHPDGEYHVAPLEYETIWAFGPNCGIDNLDVIAELNRMANDLGLDTIDLGSSLGIAMEAGWLAFGDGAGAVNLIREIYQPTDRGAILMQGAARTATALGTTRSPTVKMQAIPGYDPRVLKGQGLVYASSPMGADHTSGYTLFLEAGSEGASRSAVDRVELARKAQARTMFLDTAGYCTFIESTVESSAAALQAMLDTINAHCGSAYAESDLVAKGLEWLRTEVRFNRAAGLDNSSDRLPRFMTEEPLPPKNVKWDVADSDIDAVFSDLQCPADGPPEPG